MERFWAKVDRQGPDECWPWTKAVDRRGYGRLRLGGGGPSHERAHRMAYRLTVGAIPRGLCVLHRCDNPPCCNPAHLFLGSHADNSADMVAKGRARGPRRPACGLANGNGKVAPDAAQAMRAMRETGASLATIGRTFGVSKPTVARHVGRR